MKKMSFAFIPLLFMTGFLIRGDIHGGASPHASQVDGPYVLYRGDSVFVKYILDDHGTKIVKQDSMPAADKANISLTVLSDQPGKPFTVKLKSGLAVEETDFSKVRKPFIISDI